MSDTLDKILPPPATIANPFTGEVVDRDDAEAIRKALAEIEEFLNELYGKHRRIYRARDEMKARLGQLKPVDLPRRRDMTSAQQKIERCPNCRHRLPVSHILEDE